MRFLIIFFFLYVSCFGQISKTTSYIPPWQIETSSFTYGNEGSKYLSSTTYLPTGSLTKGINVAKIDACGDVLWNKTYFITTKRLYQRQILFQTLDNSIFVMGYIEEEGTLIKSLVVLKLTTDGEIVFSKSYSFGDFEYGYMYENYIGSNGIDIHGKYPKIGGGYSHGALIRISNSGEIIHANRYFDTFTGLSTVKITEDSYMIRTASYLYLTHVDGTIYWAKEFSELLEGSNFFQGKKIEEGYVFLMGKQKEFYLTKFSDTGELIWTSKKIPFEFRPQLLINKKNEIVLTSFILNNGSVKPYFVSLNKEGELLRSEILEDLGIKINNYPFVGMTPDGEISALYSASNSTALVFSENISNSQCRIDVDVEEIDHMKLSDSNPIPFQLNALISSSIVDLKLDTISSLIPDSVRCESIIIEDSVFISAKIDCDNPYFFSDETKNASYYWPQDGSEDSEKYLDSVGIYNVIVETCNSRTIKTIEIKSICGCKLQIPNIFTPNNDLDNDVFQIVDICETSFFEIEIYDRWGKKMYEANSVDLPWDGNFNGKKVDSGLYVYKIRYKTYSIQDEVKLSFMEGVIAVIY